MLPKLQFKIPYAELFLIIFFWQYDSISVIAANEMLFWNSIQHVENINK